MFTANPDGSITSWDARTGQERVTFPTDLSSVTALTACPSGNALAAADEEGRVAVIHATPSE
jgi:hypothetical protein